MKFSKNISKNISVINSYRAIGIILVMIAHFTCNITGFFDSPALPYIHNIGFMAVVVFFTISGFVIPWWLYNCQYQLKDYFRFVARRMIRIEPPFIIAMFLAIAYAYVRSSSQYYNGVDTIPTGKQILLQLGYLVPFFEGERWIRDAYWTLAVECQWYLVMGLLFPFFFHKNRIIRIAVYMAILIPCHFVNQYLLQYFPVLLMGTLLCSYVTNTIEKYEYIGISVVYLSYLFFKDGWMVVVASTIIIPMLLLFANYNNKKLNFVGNMSYSVYLMHSLTGTALVNYFSHIVTNPILKVVVVIGGIAFTLVSSYIFYRLIEKTSHKLSLKIAVNEHELKPKQK
jgi:peptidoglycan/LPS O-acetylase OafA/YrhL